MPQLESNGPWQCVGQRECTSRGAESEHLLEAVLVRGPRDAGGMHGVHVPRGGLAGGRAAQLAQRVARVPGVHMWCRLLATPPCHVINPTIPEQWARQAWARQQSWR